MKTRNIGILKKAIALFLAMLLLGASLPAALAQGEDWSQLMISVSPGVPEGEMPQGTYYAEFAGNDAEGIPCFWVRLADNTPLTGLTFEAYLPGYDYSYSTYAGNELVNVVDATGLDGFSCQTISVSQGAAGDMPGTGMIRLYVSVSTDRPLPGQEPAYSQDYSDTGFDAFPGQDYSDTGYDAYPGQDYSETPSDAFPGQDYSDTGYDAYPEQDYSEVPAEEIPQQDYSEVPYEEVPQQDYSEVPVEEVPQQDYSEVPAEEIPQQDYSEVPAEEVPQQDYSEVPAEEVPQQDYSEVPAEEVPQQDYSEVPAEEVPQQDYSEVPAEEVPQQDYSEIPAEEVPQQDYSEIPAEEVPQQDYSEVPVSSDVFPTGDTNPAGDDGSADGETEMTVPAEQESVPQQEYEVTETADYTEQAPATENKNNNEAGQTAVTTERTPESGTKIEEGILLNRYAKTVSFGVYLFKEQSAGSEILADLADAGTVVYLIEAQTDAAGESWVLVDYIGILGYVRTWELSELTEDESTAVRLAQGDQAPYYESLEDAYAKLYAQAPAADGGSEQGTPGSVTDSSTVEQETAGESTGEQEPAGEPTGGQETVGTDTGNQETLADTPLENVGTQEVPGTTEGVAVNGDQGTGEGGGASQGSEEQQEAEPTEAPTIPMNEMINRYGITNKKVNFRTGPSTDDGRITELKKNTPVYMIYTENNDQGDAWTFAEVNGQTGYIKTEFLDALTEEDSDETARSLGAEPHAYTMDEYAALTAKPGEPTREEQGSAEGPGGIPETQEAEQPGIPETQEAEQPGTPETTGETGTESGDSGSEAGTEEEQQEAEPTEAPTIPVNEMINRYGVTDKKVFFRGGPSTNDTKLGELKKNTPVYMIYTETDAKGDAWTFAEVNGQTGYIKTEFLNALTEEDSDETARSLGAEPHVYTMDEYAALTAKPEEPTREEQGPAEGPGGVPETQEAEQPGIPETQEAEQPGTPETIGETGTENGESGSEAGTEEEQQEAEPTEAPTIPVNEMINRYGVTDKKVFFRGGPSTNDTKLGELKKNTPVYMIYTETDAKGDAWTFAEVNGQTGYIKTEFLNALTEEDSDETARNLGAEPHVYTMDEYAALTAKPEEPAREEKKPADETDNIPVTKETEKTDTQETAGETGQESTETRSEEPPKEEKKEAEPTPSATIPVNEMINRYGKTTKKVFFRKEASASASKIKELKKNTHVFMIYNQEDADGVQWTYAQVDGKTGYIKTEFLSALTQEDSDAWNNSQASPAPVVKLEEIFPTEVPTAVVTIEATEEPTVAPTPTPTPTPKPTDTPEPTPTPTEKPTDTPTPTPTEKPTDTPTPTEKPTAEPTDEPTDEPTPTPTAEPTDTPTSEPTEAPTATPTEAPTDEPTATPVPAPTEEPYQRIGYAITIGDGVHVREWPSYSSTFKDELSANEIVYVNGQTYVDGTPWSMVEYDGNWGYVRADMLRMISDAEMPAYINQIQVTQDPNAVNTVAPYQYNEQDQSCYGYVTQDKVNFRTAADKTTGRVIKKLNKYALCLVYGSEQSNGETWYRVGYGTDVGYVNGQYFKQMNVGEAEEFLNSSLYTEGLANNTTQTDNTGTSSGTSTTGTASGIVSAEDQQVSEWVNPASGSTVSYEPFDPFATPAPLEEGEIANSEYLDSLVSKLKEGTLKQEDLETELGKFYKDAADPEGSVSAAMAYILEKTGLSTETPSESPEPIVTEEAPEFQQEESSGGGAGWLIAVGLLAAAGGGGYYWYASTQKKRQAAQRMAQKKVAEQRKNQAQGGNRAKQAANKQGQTASAQNGAKVRTGNYTSQGGTTAAKPVQTETTPRKVYSGGVENPYGRYSSSAAEEDATYTASFKPDAGASRTKRARSGAGKVNTVQKNGTANAPKTTRSGAADTPKTDKPATADDLKTDKPETPDETKA